MATFRVGQRVRVTGCYAGASDWVVSRVGQETTIVEVGVLFPAAPGNLVTGYTVDMEHPEWGPVAFAEHQLEPIQYDGNQKVEWSECLWQPDRELAA